ncbi:MAG: MEDS domain-containing protein [Pseudonocardiaceae bacterium]
MASDRFVEQIRLARATAVTAREVRDEALAARARCLDVVRQDRSLRQRIGDGRLGSGSAAARPRRDSTNVRALRMVGRADSARSLPSHGHLCWAYQDRADFLARAVECILDGVALGQRVEYVGSGVVETLRADLAGLDGIRDVLDDGDVAVSLVADFYPFYGHSHVVDPVAAVAARVAATEEALSAGYTGFRVVADATAVVRTPEQRDAFARYEHLLDRQMTVRPLSALCAYDSSELGGAAVAELACLHPLANAGCGPFQLYAEQGVDFALTGDIDLSCDELFSTTLRRVVPLSFDPQSFEPELVVDGQALTFIDHQRLLVLIAAAQRAGATVVLQNAPGTAARVAEVLKLRGVQVQPRS